MNISYKVKLIADLAKIQFMASRRFDNALGGISLNEFIILLSLNQATDGKLRRVDLADQVGLTASGITRLLLPMEKIGLIKKEADSRDARASYVLIASGGKRKLEEGLERAELLSNDIMPDITAKELESMSKFFAALAKNLK